MTSGDEADVDRVRAALVDVVEEVFDTVGEVQAAAGGLLSADGGAMSCDDRARRRFDERVQRLLASPGQLAVGAGLIVAARPERDQPLALRWWQADAGGGATRALEPDLRPASLGYYDPEAAEWFAEPRRTGRRHVVGPYVDVHGTGQYLLTLTAPVVAGAGFAGVAGADVPVRRFETHLLSTLGEVATPLVLLGHEARVVLSTCSRWLVGDLAPELAPLAGTAVPGLPWRVHPITRTVLAS